MNFGSRMFLLRCFYTSTDIHLWSKSTDRHNLERHAPVNVCQSTKQVMRSKERHPELRHRQDYIKAEIWNRLWKSFCCPEGSQKHQKDKTQKKEETKELWTNHYVCESWIFKLSSLYKKEAEDVTNSPNIPLAHLQNDQSGDLIK